jgi:hypothetical protein
VTDRIRLDELRADAAAHEKMRGPYYRHPYAAVPTSVVLALVEAVEAALDVDAHHNHWEDGSSCEICETARGERLQAALVVFGEEEL